MDGSRSTQKGIAFVHRKRVSPEEKSSNFNLQHEGAEIGAADLGFGLRVDVSLRRQLCLRLEAIASRERERERAHRWTICYSKLAQVEHSLLALRAEDFEWRGVLGVQV